MTQSTTARAIQSTLVLLCIFHVGCDRSQPVNRSNQQIVDGVRSAAAKILKKDASEIDLAKSFVALGADELDIVEIVVAVEEAFKVQIPDKAVADASKTLTVQDLAELASKQPDAR